jgi:hypothetical protein
MATPAQHQQKVIEAAQTIAKYDTLRCTTDLERVAIHQALVLLDLATQRDELTREVEYLRAQVADLSSRLQD